MLCRIGHDDDGRLPGGRLTRALPPRANGHDGGAWCERRNRAASERWAPRSPGHPASRLHPHALRRAAFDNIGSDRRGLRARHADTHAQSNTHGARGLKVRRSPSIGRASRSPEQITWRSYHHLGITTAVPILKLAPRLVADDDDGSDVLCLREELHGVLGRGGHHAVDREDDVGKLTWSLSTRPLRGKICVGRGI